MKAIRKSYPTDLTDEQWELIKPMIPLAKTGGRPRTTNMKEVFNALLYMVRAGCAWRLLPNDFPKWPTVYDYFREWKLDGTWEKMNDRLRQYVRVIEDHHPHPSASALDSQSVATASMIKQDVGYDAAKKTKGRKRHLLVDTLGLVLTIVVTAADTPEREGAKQVLAKTHQQREKYPRLVRIWVDGGYRGEEFLRWVMDTYLWALEVVLRPREAQGFVLLPRRWVVERTFGWLNWSRRLSKDYERSTDSAQSFIYISMIGIMLRRLA
jgi:transposase